MSGTSESLTPVRSSSRNANYLRLDIARIAAKYTRQSAALILPAIQAFTNAERAAELQRVLIANAPAMARVTEAQLDSQIGIIMKGAGYRDAMDFIALNDEDAERDVEQMQLLATTLLVSSIFGAPIEKVATDVLRLREKADAEAKKEKEKSDRTETSMWHETRLLKLCNPYW